MQIDANWLRHPGTVAVMEVLQSAGHQAYFVGGCVRNSALGAPVADIDIASDARPERVMALAEAAGLKSIGTGIDHGTVTVVAEGLAHEVTTYRQRCRNRWAPGRGGLFGRHGRGRDARRDFTMNALYARGDGTVLDPTGQGLADDLRRPAACGSSGARRTGSARITSASCGSSASTPGTRTARTDTRRKTLAAISSLSRRFRDDLQAERIGQEMRKLLAAPEASPALGNHGTTPVSCRRVLARCGYDPLGPLAHSEHALDQRPAWLCAAVAAAAGGAGRRRCDKARLRLSRSRGPNDSASEP